MATAQLVDEFERDLTAEDQYPIEDPMIHQIRNGWTRSIKNKHHKHTPRITQCKPDDGTMGPRYRTNQSEMGRDYDFKLNSPDRKLNYKTIDIAWRDVGTMGNVAVVIGSFVLLTWVFSRK